MAEPSGPPVRIVFVCVGNACRSQMAEGFARALLGDPAEVHSAGSHPAGWVHPMAVRLMAEKGVDIGGQSSKGLADLPAGVTWDCVVTMGCGDACPQLAARRRLDWALPDPVGMDEPGFRDVRDEIERRVRRLAAELSGAPPAGEGGP